jgi:hypothetical protein
MKKQAVQLLNYLIAFIIFIAGPIAASAQCAICSRTAAQMGERPASALNAGIIYLAFAPLAIFGYIGYRWWKSNHSSR